VRLQGRFYLEWCSVPLLSVDCREVNTKDPTYPSHGFCSRDRMEVNIIPSNDLGDVLGEPVGTQLQRSIGLRI
jgi:hypothetical protein